MSQKIAAISVGLVIAAFAAVAVLAGPDATPTGEPFDATATPTEEIIDGEEPTPTPTETEPEPLEPTPTDVPDEGDEADGPRDIKGIPDDNPKFSPLGEGEDCEKWKTKVKETPGGTKVSVPCHAGEKGPPAHANPNNDE